MTFRAQALLCVVVAGAIASLASTRGYPAQQWLHFFVYLAAILLSSGMKIAMPKSNATMCVNFPFILLGIVELSPYQAVALAACSVVAQCRIRVVRPFTMIQILFNVANVITATVLAWYTYAGAMAVHREVAPAIAAASTVYFLANTVPVALIIAWESGTAPFQHWRREFFWYFPFYLVGAALAAAANFVSLRFGWMTSLLLIPVIYIMYRAYCVQLAMVRDREQHIIEIEALHVRTIEGLAMAIEAKDKNTHRHLMRVRVYVSEMGKLMGLDSSLMKALETASFLHDIGKLAVPEYILNKPGKLTREEFEKMKIHPAVGAEILERVRFPYPVVPIVRSHHESWDGGGYPDGLKEKEIPIGARILTAVDCFDALASDRPYRKAMPLEEAMAMLKSKAGQQFDPEIVALLDQHYREFEAKARQQIDAIAPLETDMVVERGLAPGAGFAPEPAFVIGGRAWEGVGTMDGSDSGLEPSLTSAAICHAVASLVPFDCLIVYVRRGESMLRQFAGGALAETFSAQPIPIGEGLSGWVAENRRPILNGNPTVEPNFVKTNGIFSADSSALAVPLIEEDALLGVLTLYSAQPAAFSAEHLLMLEAHQTKFALAIKGAADSAQAGRNDLPGGKAHTAPWLRAAV